MHSQTQLCISLSLSLPSHNVICQLSVRYLRVDSSSTPFSQIAHSTDILTLCHIPLLLILRVTLSVSCINKQQAKCTSPTILLAVSHSFIHSFIHSQFKYIHFTFSYLSLSSFFSSFPSSFSTFIQYIYTSISHFISHFQILLSF